MIRKNHISIVYTNNVRKTKSINDLDRKKCEGGVMFMICPQSGNEIKIPFKNKKERLEWIELKKEIRQELKMVS